MKQFEYTVKDPDGIHARPAGILVKEAGKYKSTVTVTKNETTADLKKIFSLMSLGVKQGDRILIEITGPDENPALEAIKSLFEENL